MSNLHEVSSHQAFSWAQDWSPSNRCGIDFIGNTSYPCFSCKVSKAIDKAQVSDVGIVLLPECVGYLETLSCALGFQPQVHFNVVTVGQSRMTNQSSKHDWASRHLPQSKTEIWRKNRKLEAVVMEAMKYCPCPWSLCWPWASATKVEPLQIPNSTLSWSVIASFLLLQSHAVMLILKITQLHSWHLGPLEHSLPFASCSGFPSSCNRSMVRFNCSRTFSADFMDLSSRHYLVDPSTKPNLCVAPRIDVAVIAELRRISALSRVLLIPWSCDEVVK